MNIVQKLTTAHLKANVRRTVTTVLGIVISVAMITAVFVSVSSLFKYFGDAAIYNGGNWDASCEVSSDQAIKLKTNNKVKRVGLEGNVDPKESGFKIDYGLSDRSSTGTMFAADKNCLSQMLTGEYEGSIPQTDDEIMVSGEFISKNNLDWSIGSSVSIPVGVRTIGGEPVSSLGYIAGEEFTPSDIKEYKIVGIIKNNKPTQDYPILRHATSQELKNATAYIELKTLNMNSRKEVKSIMNSAGVQDYNVNDDVMNANLSFSPKGAIVETIIPMASVVLAIIMIAGFMLIYNAFGISLQERTRYLGMLASVGATKRQKRSSVYFEGFILGLIGIPVGVGAGILGITITLNAVGNKILSSGLAADISNVSFKTSIPWPVIVGVVILSALTIFISAIVPAKKASAITPISALKQSTDIKIKGRKLKSSKLIRLIFGCEGEIADKNLKRNGKKSRVVISSIALSVVLFLTCNYFCSLFLQANNTMASDIPYQVDIYCLFKGEQDKQYFDMCDYFLNDAKSMNGVDDAYYIFNNVYQFGKKGNANEDIASQNNVSEKYSDFWKSGTIYVNYISDDKFNELCKENGIDPASYYEVSNSGEINCLLMDNISHKKGENNVFSQNIIGKQIFNNYDQEKICKNTVSALIDYSSNDICGLNPKNNASAFAPISAYKKAAFAGFTDKTSASYSIAIKTENHAEVTDAVNKSIDDYVLINNLSNCSFVVQDVVKTFQAMSTTLFIIQVFCYGFIALMILISFVNILNTVTTGIDLRRREFAMFKSVGITPKGFNKMICLESLLYGIKALVISIPVSILLSFLMNVLLGSDQIPFTVNVPLYLAVVAVVFVLVGSGMLLAVSKLKKDSIIEALKEDIC